MGFNFECTATFDHEEPQFNWISFFFLDYSAATVATCTHVVFL